MKTSTENEALAEEEVQNAENALKDAQSSLDSANSTLAEKKQVQDMERRAAELAGPFAPAIKILDITVFQNVSCSISNLSPYYS